MKKNPALRRAMEADLDKMPVSTQLAVARREAGLTQSEVAQKLHVSQSAIAQIERPDGNPRIETVWKMRVYSDITFIYDRRAKYRVVYSSNERHV